MKVKKGTWFNEGKGSWLMKVKTHGSFKKVKAHGSFMKVKVHGSFMR